MAPARRKGGYISNGYGSETEEEYEAKVLMLGGHQARPRVRNPPPGIVR